MISNRTLPLLVGVMVAGLVSACASQPSRPASDQVPMKLSPTASLEPTALSDDESGQVPQLREDGVDPVPADLRQLARMFVESLLPTHTAGCCTLT